MRIKKLYCALLAVLLLLTSAAAVSAEPVGKGTVIINQVYGASNDGYASHSFIELYNPSAAAVNLSGWSVQYKSSVSGAHADKWQVLPLTGSIAAGEYYLIRCGAVDKPSGSYQVPEGNQEWNIQLHNKGLAVVLMSTTEPLTEAFAGNVTTASFKMPQNFVDLAAVQGNDGTVNQQPPAYEGAFAALQSKKKAIRRIGFTDTDNNKTDFEVIDYSKTVEEAKGPHARTQIVPPSYTPVTTTNEKYYGFYNEFSSLKSELSARYNAGAFSVDGGSAEITAYNFKNQFAYSVNGVKGVLDCFRLALPSASDVPAELSGTEISVSSLVADADSSFTYGDMTSVAVSPDGASLAIALQDADYTKPGRVALFSCGSDGSLTFTGMATTCVQPDMVTFNEDGTLILTADEGEPREGYGSTSVDPEGSVTIISTEGLTSVTVDFSCFDSKRAELVEQRIVIKKNTLPSVDFEPEYIAVAGSKAYVSLQEANAIAVLDIDAQEFLAVYSVGFEDYSVVPVDLDKGDKKYQPAVYEAIKGIRMPDGISTCVINGETYLLTANEGDSRAWPVSSEEFVNEIKSNASPVNQIAFPKKITWFDVSQYDGLAPATDYIFGGRSFTLFRITETGLEEVFDSADDFERITAEKMPDYFNCSNDIIDVEDRSGKKGPEPEGVTVGQIEGRIYAFIGLERISGVMIYDITDPENAVFENYINSRDFSDDIKNDVSPEGLCFISADQSPDGSSLLLASNEVSGTVNVIKLSFECVHDWEDGYTVDKVPTCTEDGIRSIHCRRCAEVKDVTVIPATGHTDENGDGLCDVCGSTITPANSPEKNPQTGDNSCPEVLVLLLLISVLSLAAIGAVKKTHPAR